MLYSALASFAFGAVIGLIMLSNWYQKRRPFTALVITHGTLNAIGLILLIVHAVLSEGDYPKVSLVFFILAALGGSYLLYTDLTKQHVSLPLAIGHGILALTGIGALLAYVS